MELRVDDVTGSRTFGSSKGTVLWWFSFVFDFGKVRMLRSVWVKCVSKRHRPIDVLVGKYHFQPVVEGCSVREIV